MSNEEREFEKRKLVLIRKMVQTDFEEACARYIKDGKWTSVEELDTWFTNSLKAYDELQLTIKNYFDKKMYYS